MPHMPGNEPGGGPSRAAQVESLVSRVLRERLMRGINDPRVQGMVSVLGVDLTPDLLNARVRISVLPADRGRLTLSGLRSATRHLESVLRTETRLRRVPRLTFELDDSLKRESAVLDAIGRAFPQGAGGGADGETPAAPSDQEPPPTTAEPTTDLEGDRPERLA
ncbi:MAG: 30S ribosome-binding factor RbfA [Phycisphaerae bacterium]|nr:30S ribosome-binding factor RbfA [Phycisphaerae bacterium]